jgi:hypothetical protein
MEMLPSYWLHHPGQQDFKNVQKSLQAKLAIANQENKISVVKVPPFCNPLENTIPRSSNGRKSTIKFVSYLCLC